MSRIIVLDSGPLGLLFQKPHFADADRSREWLKNHFAAGAQAIVPEIIVYELRRELLRLKLIRGRRFASIEALRCETAAWQQQSNEKQRGVDWQFKVDDARLKLKSVYPKIIV